jgi:hypothetical protein
MSKRFKQLDDDAPPVPSGLRPRPGVFIGCGEATCRDCYEPETRQRPAWPRTTVTERRDA